MNKIATALIETSKGLEPLTLAILVTGLISLSAIWLAAIAIKAALQNKSK
jgi:hypothetical protein